MVHDHYLVALPYWLQRLFFFGSSLPVRLAAGGPSASTGNCYIVAIASAGMATPQSRSCLSMLRACS